MRRTIKSVTADDPAAVTTTANNRKSAVSRAEKPRKAVSTGNDDASEVKPAVKPTVSYYPGMVRNFAPRLKTICSRSSDLPEEFLVGYILNCGLRDMERRLGINAQNSPASLPLPPPNPQRKI